MHSETSAGGNAFSTASLAGVLGLALFAYWGVLHAPFHFDDSLYLESPQVAEPGNLGHLIRPAQTRQLSYLTFYMSYRLGGANPWGYHLVSLLFHLGNSFLVYLFVRLLIERAADVPGEAVRQLLPVAAAGIFALHPVQSEAVNYAYQRCTLLAAFFSLLAMIAYLRSMRAARRNTWRLLVIFCWLLAAASKESAWILPLVLFAHLWVHSRDLSSFRALLRRSSIFTAVTGVLMLTGAGWVYYGLQHSGDSTVGTFLSGDSLRYLISQVQVFATYLKFLVWPTGYSIDHDFRTHPAGSPYGLGCLLLLLGLFALAVHIRKSRPTASFLCLSFIILLVPTSSILASSDLLFEHRLYLPMIAGATLLAWGILAGISALVASERARRATCLGVLGVLMAAYTGLSHARTYVWADDIRLWADAVAKAPGKVRAHYNLGVAYLDKDPEAARREFMEVTKLSPNHSPALYNLGWIEQSRGHCASAKRYYLASLKADAGNWRAHQNLGNLDVLLGLPGDAVMEYEETIRTQPDYWPAYQSLATLQLQEGKSADALSTLQKLKVLRPTLLEAWYLSAYALVESKKYAEADAELHSIEARDTGRAYRRRIEELRRQMGFMSAKE